MATHDRATAGTGGIERAADAIDERAEPLDEDAVSRIADELEDESFVLFGEASHGTSEYYRWRARLTAELVERGEASFVAVEGDWTDCYEVNRWIRGNRTDENASDVLGEFDRWPTWMWANWEVAALVERLRAYNRDRPAEEEVGFYGLDVYSLFESMEAVIAFLEDFDPEAAERARDAYRCFEPYGEDAREYGRSTRIVPDDCEDEVIEIRAELRRDFEDASDDAESEDRFAAEQNALVAKNAEEYYRTMVRGSDESWNVRDRHMAETLDRLAERNDVAGDGGTAIVWAHNTHVGDARATDMPDRGRLNLGQLVRERHGDEDTAIVGFGTHRGSVIAANSWGADHEEMRVPEAREGSVGDVFHRGRGEDCWLVDTDDPALRERRGHRAIGVVYDPERESFNYVPTNLAERYDLFVHVEESTALHPLHPEPEMRESPDLYPWGV
ncbi:MULTISPECIES: erythromycin esterase family protein [Halorussus]|uniref:erythromycin esterase family protein n=1 Tax=Halorussus TaxID=1070314 RepID=UPI00209E9794|nr:erythromycin esterase family protein [Halorussus vallis]USZ77293.1 erythromycin esterase family protein [Halorussus vallis]